MAAKKKTETELPPIEIDEFSRIMFEQMGFSPVPRVLAETYIQFKRRHDIIKPCRLSQEGYATVVALAELKDPDAFGKPAPAATSAPTEPQKKAVVSEDEIDTSDPFRQD